MATAAESPAAAKGTALVEIDRMDFFYGATQALHGITLPIEARKVTALIGPSGCGKSTLLRCLNRMNDLIEGTRVAAGTIRIHGVDIYQPDIDVIELRKRVGMVFQKSNPFPKSIYENVTYGLRLQGLRDKARLGATGRIRLANRAAGELFGFSPPAADRTVLEATRHHDVAALVARLDHEAEVLNHELRLEAVAETRWLQVNALALRAADGASDGAILVFHDLTRLRQLEAVRQDFVANVSHELRTPLSLIKSAAETLIDGGKQDPAITTRFLEIIDKHANRLTLLIDDLLLLSRLDSGRVELNLQPVALRNAAQEALDDAALIARGRGVTLENAVPAGLRAQADPERLRQVLANLIDNAIKYGRADGHVVLHSRAIEGARVELAVRDDGPGIPLEATARIFERFYRVDKARSREQGGTGLGLAIVKNVIQAHGGEVRVESTPGAGTEFFITLPAAK